MQLCLRFASKADTSSYFQDPRRFRRDKLRLLAISRKTALECDARAVCDLYPCYPNSSINWWCESDNAVKNTIISHNMSPLSPYIPYGVICCHFLHLNCKDLRYFKQTINCGMMKHVKMELPRWYT